MGRGRAVALVWAGLAALAALAVAGGGGDSAETLVSAHDNKDIFLSGAIESMPGVNLLFVKTNGGKQKILCESRLENSRMAWRRKDGVIVQLSPELEIAPDPTSSGGYECFSQKHSEWTPVEAFVVVESGDVTTASSLDVIKPNASQDLLLDCSLQGSEQPPEWYHNGHKLDPSERLTEQFDNGSLLIKFVNSMHSGIYHCAFPIEQGGKEEVRYGWVAVQGEGYVHQGHAVSKNMMEGEDVGLECEVYGFPVPKVTWNVGGRRLEDMNRTDPPGRFLLSAHNGVPNAHLTVKRLIFDDREKYYCCAENSLNTNAANCEYTMVRVKDKLAALWPFLGILAEVVILVTIIFIYEKRRASKEDADDDNAPEQRKGKKDAL